MVWTLPINLCLIEMLFLDMQWVDPSSVLLLESMMLNTTMNSLLIVCAYRDNEIQDAHPFKQLVDEISSKKKNSFQVKLRELDSDCVANLIMDACHCTEQKARPFAELV
jgi:predicted ATPase